MNAVDAHVPEAYTVVVNHEEQYALWPLGRPHAPGWREAGKSGSREECLAFVRAVWTDMCPRSLRAAGGGDVR